MVRQRRSFGLVWRPEDVSFELEDDATSFPVVTVTFATPIGFLWMVAERAISGIALVLKGLHIHDGSGIGRNAVRPGNLRVLAPSTACPKRWT